VVLDLFRVPPKIGNPPDKDFNVKLYRV